jgi:beta-N-acetylhexosaminidase
MMGNLILDIEGVELSREDQEILQHPAVCGVILFTRNYQSTEQLNALIQAIRNTTSKRLLIGVDQEGGRVQRFREGFISLPALRTIGHLYDEQPQKALYIAQQHAWLMATELLALDIDFSFAPVLDLDKSLSEVIGDRAFHGSPAIVSALGMAYLQGMRQAGMGAIGKHFPGHGSVAADSHTAIPIDTRPYDAIVKEDIVPFADMATYLTGIMPAHVIYSAVDPLPAGFSSFWLQTELRQRLGFTGAIFSDDLTMAGAAVVGSIAERAALALAAGCDALLVCNDRASAIAVLTLLENRQPYDALTESRLQNMYGKATLPYNELHNTVAWRDAIAALKPLL